MLNKLKEADEYSFGITNRVLLGDSFKRTGDGVGISFVVSR